MPRCEPRCAALLVSTQRGAAAMALHSTPIRGNRRGNSQESQAGRHHVTLCPRNGYWIALFHKAPLSRATTYFLLLLHHVALPPSGTHLAHPSLACPAQCRDRGMSTARCFQLCGVAMPFVRADFVTISPWIYFPLSIKVNTSA